MPVAVQIREAGRAIASYPGRKLGKALDQWCEDNRATIQDVNTLSLYAGLATVTVQQGEVKRVVDAVVIVG